MLNHIDLIGRMVRDPECKRVSGDTALCNFTVAVDDDYKDSDGNKVTDFVECTAWRKTAEYIAKYQAKGSLVAVSGRLKSRKWEDKDGNKRTSWFVQVDNAYGVGGKREDQQNNMYTGGYQAGANYTAPAPGIGQPTIYAGEDYAVLTDDDEQLPF